jgi:hypothetical protein
MKYEIKLTDEQMKIANHLNTPLRVLAGMGIRRRLKRVRK